MVTINILPWRHQQGAKARRAYLMTCFLTVVVLLIAALFWQLHIQHCARQLLREQQAINLAQTKLSKQQQEINMLAHQQQHRMKAIEVSSKDQQRLRVTARLLRRISETLPEGAILRLIELSDQTIKLKVLISENCLKPPLLTALLHLPELKSLRVQQVQRLKDSPNYELALLGSLGNQEVTIQH
jgi:Tfp pilus assembly protein PilN